MLPVDFLDVANGAVRTITLPTEGKTLQVTIPEGAEDRQSLRLKGQGMPGFGGGPAGDAYVELHVQPHPFFNRKDDNIHVEVPVTLKEAVLGARIEVPTIGGPVAVINLKVVLPTAEEPELVAFLETWQPKTQRDPRKEMLS